MDRRLVSMALTTLIVIIFMLVSDFMNSNLEINNFFSYLFSFETLFLILTFGTLFFILLIPAAYLIEDNLKIKQTLSQIGLYLVIGGLISPVITFLLKREYTLNLHLSLSITGAFLLFGLIQNVKVTNHNR
ncbi:hypothetical protein AWM68_17830 [Fictibacillus phosphorivorans]|uniref:Uncharacterized protein n=1 Tax=Fictibacillus phosphorivorans TaxID=1221500 RepID=A0A165NXA3_9BACL|nr:hypothetical protein [Fictibacillus phosphorivorans]KZE68030.1 hypothetical protein AWM68_17830 [Fictibacillus phosphorivorans]